ncbi:MAG: hypothetical protein WDN01_16680 [Rhizomicrobium sp.]
MYQVLKDFAGPVATVIAALSALSVTAYFAWHQKTIAEQKLRFDLFGRRLAIFDSIFDYWDAMVSWKGTPEQEAAKRRFFHAYQESKFLFSNKSEIESLLKGLNEKGGRVIYFKENPELYVADPAFYHKKFEEIQDIQLNDFENGLLRLKEAIAPYLNFHDV